MQRLRSSFSRGKELKFLSHLDLMRLWERTFRRAGIRLAYSEGFTPHPRISLAAPLSVGVTGQAEMMDVFFTDWMSPHSFMTQIKGQLPRGIEITETKPVGLDEPSLQSQVRFAEYLVQVETEAKTTEVEAMISSLLAAKEIPWEHHRDTGVRKYELRHLIDSIRFIALEDGLCTLGMTLLCSSSGAGRPEQVSRALGFPHHPRSIHRAKLILS
jgi:radical SAM-linked protein